MEQIEMLTDGQYIQYKGKPLLRDKNSFVYGSMTDKYVVQLNVISWKEVARADGSKLSVPDAIFGLVVSTDHTKPFQERVMEQFQKKGLALALEWGEIRLKTLSK